MKKENPDFYKLDHKLAIKIWEALNQVDHPCLPNILSKTMIEQVGLMLISNFKKEILTNNNFGGGNFKTKKSDKKKVLVKKFGEKNWSKKNCVPKLFGPKKYFGLKISFVKKFFGPKAIFGPKIWPIMILMELLQGTFDLKVMDEYLYLMKAARLC